MYQIVENTPLHNAKKSAGKILSSVHHQTPAGCVCVNVCVCLWCVSEL